MTDKIRPCGLFSKRATLTEAVEYSSSLIKTLPRVERGTAYTALWVSVNTALAEIDKLDLASTHPYSIPELDALADTSVDNSSPEELRRHVRTALPLHLARCFQLAQIAPRLAEDHTLFAMLIVRLFSLDKETLLAEVESLLSRQ
jgi:hypothetical protein